MRQEEAIERLLTLASVERARGNLTKARRLVEQALEQAPDRPDIYELLGDIFFALGDLPMALKHFRKAHELAPERLSAEEKMAYVLAEMESQKQKPEIPYFPKKPPLALLLSAFIPGLGQVYNEEFLKGIIVFLVAWGPLRSFLMAFDDLFVPALRGQEVAVSPLQILTALGAGFLSIGAWTYALWDAYQTAKRITEIHESRRREREKKLGEGEERGDFRPPA